MKQTLFKIAVFFKRPNVINRLILLGGSLLLLFTMAIPDLKFNLEMKNPKKFSVEQIQTTAKEVLPRYIVLENAQLMKVGTALTDSAVNSLFNGKIKLSNESPLKLMNFGYNYVIQQRVKKGDTTLSSVTYPVYSKSEIQKTANASSSNLTAFVVIKDSHVTKEQLEGDKYFNDSTFSINGRFDGSTIDSELLKLLQENGYNVSKDAIILEKGNTPMTLASAIIFTLITSLFALFCFLGFLPLSLLCKIFGVEQEIIKIKD